ncbi:hypothetical protein OAL04_09810, partial [Nitrospinae bacterium]|nr:hypothetical protein [Nitrospinota bacterium]
MALVTRVVVPVTVSAPVSVMFPVVAVPLKVPPMVEAAKSNPASFTTVTAPVLCGDRVKVPSTAIESRLITPLFASVVATKLPP